MRVLSLFVVLLSLFSATVPLFAQQSDDAIYDEVRRRLAGDRDVKGGGIEVVVASGVVTLRGKVHEDKQKNKAERIAKKVKGVTKVVNELTTEVGAGTIPDTGGK